MDDNPGGCLIVFLVFLFLILFCISKCSGDNIVSVKGPIEIQTVLETKDETVSVSTSGKIILKNDTVKLEKQKNMLDKDVIKLEAQLKEYENAD